MQVVIEPRFHGPPDSGNGGTSCGLLAEALDGPAEVTLRVPPPLGRPLEVVRHGERAELRDGDVLVAEAVPATVDVDPGAPAGLADAAAAGARYPWRDEHPYPGCFVCGPAREPGDGLRIFCGPLQDGTDRFAGTWTPSADLAGEDGLVRPPFVWAALDCPSGVAATAFGGVGLMLLGRMAADLRGPARPGEPHVLLAWPLDRDGRKLHTASALLDAAGEVLAVARATWIELRGA